MKSVMKRIGSRIWALGAPVRRPFLRRVHVFARRSVDQSICELVHPPLAELLQGVATMRREVGCYRNETNLLLDSLVREVVRLQHELDALREERGASGTPLSVVQEEKPHAA